MRQASLGLTKCQLLNRVDGHFNERLDYRMEASHLSVWDETLASEIKTDSPASVRNGKLRSFLFLYQFSLYR